MGASAADRPDRKTRIDAERGRAAAQPGRLERLARARPSSPPSGRDFNWGFGADARCLHTRTHAADLVHSLNHLLRLQGGEGGGQAVRRQAGMEQALQFARCSYVPGSCTAPSLAHSMSHELQLQRASSANGHTACSHGKLAGAIVGQHVLAPAQWWPPPGHMRSWWAHPGRTGAAPGGGERAGGRAQRAQMSAGQTLTT